MPDIAVYRVRASLTDPEGQTNPPGAYYRVQEHPLPSGGTLLVLRDGVDYALVPNDGRALGASDEVLGVVVAVETGRARPAARR